ncbi:MAG: RNA polymerase sigma factor [Lachnospiraceae bacterium]|nr:RNA polymerase sigma factor [Lachnospiraceae bacterium]
MAREEELIEQIKNGRRECLDELVAFYYPAILRYCLWHMPDRESALDATQETFLKLVRFLGQYENRGAFRAFLYRIAANTCIDMKRKQPATESLSEAVTETACAPECGYQIIEDRQQLAAALTHLDNDMRELILLRYGQELTMREIADITGTPLRTVQTRLRRAVKVMREVLE